MPAAGSPDYAGMKLMLTADCEAVLEAIAITIKHEAGEMHAQLPNGAAIVLALRGAKRGAWFDKSDMSGGDMLELVHRALGKPDHRVAYDWGKRFFGMADSAQLAARRAAVMAQQVRARETRLSLTERVRRGLARYLSSDSLPLPQAPALAAYLAGRGIALDSLPGVPKTLRFSAAQRHTETGRDWPAMLAPIVDPMRPQVIAAHITFLTEGAAGGWQKAPIRPAKKVSAPYRGCIIPLLRGASGKSLSLAPEGDTVLIAEGIENALAAAIMLLADPVTPLPQAPRVFAAVSAPNLPHIKLPARFAEVILACDNDGENPAVHRARALAERNWLEAGLAVCWRFPPPQFKDFAAALAASRSLEAICA